MVKKQLGVIYGSKSCEHEVSIISAVQFMNAVDRDKYNVVPVYVALNGQWFTGDPLFKMAAYTPFNPNAEGLVPVSLDLATHGELVTYQISKGLFKSAAKRRVVASIDCMCIVMHGMNGEDGTLQGLLEMANIPYTSTAVAGAAIGMDKIMIKQFFKGAGLPVLPSTWLARSAFEQDRAAAIAKVEDALSYPVFVKPANLGSSIGVSKAVDSETLSEALELAFSFDRRVLVEKGLNAPVEINCAVRGFDGRCEASVLEMPNTGGGFLSFYEKYLKKGGTSQGMASLARLVPAPVSDALRDKIQAMAKDIFAMLDSKGVVRIDFMMEAESDTFYITEINTIPGSLAYYLWEHDGLPYQKLIDEMIDYAFLAHAEKNRHNYAFTSDILKGISLGAKSTGTKNAAGKL